MDAKEAKKPTELKKIARRNKKYMLTFADKCDELFIYLDFVPVEETSLEPEVSFPTQTMLRGIVSWSCQRQLLVPLY
jgi:hypothetical protein